MKKIIIAAAFIAYGLSPAHAAGKDIKNLPNTSTTLQYFKKSANGASVLLDTERAQRFAQIAADQAIYRFTGRCYEYVAKAMEAAGIIDPADWEALGIGPNHAIDFASWANDNPTAMLSRLGLARIPAPADYNEIPTGSIMVFEPGFCGYSSTSGHIAVVTPDRSTCSDGCENLNAIYNACVSSEDSLLNIYVYTPVKMQ